MFPMGWLFRLGFMAAVASGLFAYVFHLGNQHGSYARAYKAVVAELAEKNKELIVLKELDTKEIVANDAAREQAHATAAVGLKTCPASKATAAKVNKIRE